MFKVVAYAPDLRVSYVSCEHHDKCAFHNFCLCRSAFEPPQPCKHLQFRPELLLEIAEYLKNNCRYP
jgi:hypothetical protein